MYGTQYYFHTSITALNLYCYQDGTLIATKTDTLSTPRIVDYASDYNIIAIQYIKNEVLTVTLNNPTSTSSTITIKGSMTYTPMLYGLLSLPSASYTYLNVSTASDRGPVGLFGPPAGTGYSPASYSISPDNLIGPTGPTGTYNGIVACNQVWTDKIIVSGSVKLLGNIFRYVPCTDCGYTITTSGGISFNGLITGSTSNPYPAGGLNTNIFIR